MKDLSWWVQVVSILKCSTRMEWGRLLEQLCESWELSQHYTPIRQTMALCQFHTISLVFLWMYFHQRVLSVKLQLGNIERYQTCHTVDEINPAPPYMWNLMKHGLVSWISSNSIILMGFLRYIPPRSRHKPVREQWERSLIRYGSQWRNGSWGVHMVNHGLITVDVVYLLWPNMYILEKTIYIYSTHMSDKIQGQWDT